MEKPLTSMKLDNASFLLGHFLQNQLDWRVYRFNDPRSFNAFAEPLPVVAEAWSRATGDYDLAAKLPLYRQLGDLEI